MAAAVISPFITYFHFTMILIADSGSTKTDWALSTGAADGSLELFATQGINPVHQSEDCISGIIASELMARPTADVTTNGSQAPSPTVDAATVSEVHFYGAGCSAERAPLVAQVLRRFFPSAVVTVSSDMLGAARAVLGRSEGIACILGTGANSCLYDGEKIVGNTPALGYILGDEGSGAVLGRLFVNAIFKNPAFSSLRDEFLAEQNMQMADVIDRVYRQPMANRFLASASLFIGRRIGNPLLSDLVVGNFRSFFRCNIVPYGRRDLPIGFVGSMACHYRQQLCEAAAAEGFVVGRILQKPLNDIVKYHVKSGE